MIALLLLFSYFGATSAGCVPCDPSAANGSSAICSDGWQTSLYENGECVFDSRVELKSVFVSGSVFTFGLCLAVTSNIGESCFENMAGQVAARLAATGSSSTGAVAVVEGCETHMLHSPCSLGEAKYTAYTSVSSVADCAVLDILYADAMEECLRHDADGRFWAAVGYLMAIIFGLGVVGGCVGAFIASVA